jgi:ABC-type glycerol-3-phosphate transport system permease component
MDAKPALATLGTVGFIGSRTSFLWPLSVVNRRDLYTDPLALNSLRTFVAETRSLLRFIFSQRYFKAIALTELKG